MSEIEFTDCLLANADYLKPFAFNLTKDKEKADDLLQDTMYRALVYKDKFNAGTNLKAWVYTIMRNIFINDYRKKSRYKVIYDGSDNQFLLNDKRQTTNGVAEAGIAAKDIWSKINSLPEIFRHPFVMFYEGYKYDEIATMLTVPLGTIKSRIHFCRKMLREQLTRK